MQAKPAMATHDRIPPNPPLESDSKTLQRLRQSTRLAFERYVDIASHCSGRLAQLNPADTDRFGRVNVALLEQREARAYEAYVKAKAALMQHLFKGAELNKAAELNEPVD